MMEQKVDMMLASRPVGSTISLTEKWDKMQDAKVAMFQKFSPGNVPIFDGSTFYDKWTDGTSHYEGMRHLITKRAHGICRRVDSNGIEEAQWKDGIRFGLNLWCFNTPKDSFYLRVDDEYGCSRYITKANGSFFKKDGPTQHHDKLEKLYRELKSTRSTE